MYKVSFEYQIDEYRYIVIAKASDVDEYGADGLEIRYEDEDGNPIESLGVDRKTYQEIEEIAVEYLNDHKHNSELCFE
jgi:hypothetical protein